jgi:mono/diheme cytochrome c family protein
MKRALKFQFALAATLLFTTACHTARRGEPLTGPLQLSSKAEHGRLLFQQRCYQCHPNGEGGLGPAINNKPAPRFLMKTQVRAGLGAMPRFNEYTIPPNDLDDIIDYLMALRKADTKK